MYRRDRVGKESRGEKKAPRVKIQDKKVIDTVDFSGRKTFFLEQVKREREEVVK